MGDSEDSHKKQRPTSSTASNEPAKLSTGIKIATFCTVFLTASLAIPLIYARRRSLASSLSSASRTTISGRHSFGASPAALLRGQNVSSTPKPRTFTPPPRKAPVEKVEDEPPVNYVQGAKDAFKALTIATTIVSATTATLYFTFKWSTGIKDMQEFTTFMRGLVANTVPPQLHSRLKASEVYEELPVSSESGTDEQDVGQWSMEQAETRLERAFQEGGLVKLGEQAVIEFEREWGAGADPPQHETKST